MAAGPGSAPARSQLPIPSHDIGPRGPHVAPGTFKVTLEVDGVAGRVAHVRGPRRSRIGDHAHAAQGARSVRRRGDGAARQVEALAADLRARRQSATGDEARASAGARAAAGRCRWRRPGGGGGGGRGGGAPPQCVSDSAAWSRRSSDRARARERSAPPTGTMRATLAEAKADLAAIERELGSGR